MKVDEKWLDEGIIKELEKLSIVKVVAGITDGDIAEYATVNEYGLNDIPARPFMRNTYQENISNYRNLVENAIYDVLGGSDAETGLTKVGMQMQNDIKDNIRNGDWTPNAPSTIERKGSSKPLIYKGAMLGAIHFEIRKGKK